LFIIYSNKPIVMKKRFYAGALLLLGNLFCITAVNAQWEIGARGGISIPNLSAGGSNNNPLNTGYSSRFGPDFGASGEYHITPRFSLDGRIEYSSQGGKKNGMQALTTPTQIAEYYESQGMTPPSYMYANYKSEAKLDYLMIPIMAKFGWRLGQESAWKFYAEVGPYAGFLLSAKQVTSGNSNLYLDPAGKEAFPGGPQSLDATTNIKNQLHSANAGVDGNIGLSYALGADRRNSIFVEAGGNYGFVNIQKGTANGKNNTGAAVATLGYSYRLGSGKYRG
jgi:outer membrane protein with beta-barrel domain